MAAEAIPSAPIFDLETEFIKHVWKVEDGLPHNTVEAVLQTRDGYIWAATLAGLARFDGVTFTVFAKRSSPEMVNDECHALAEDIEGNLWIGTFDGLLRYRDGSFTRFTTQDGLFGNEIRRLRANQEGGVWIGWPRALEAFRPGHVKRYGTSDGFKEEAINQLYVDASGILWVSSADRLYRQESSTERFFKAVPFEFSRFGHITAMYLDSDGTLWSVLGNLLVQFKGDRMTILPGQETTDKNPTPGFAQPDQLGGFWFTRAIGELHRFHKGIFQRYRIGTGSFDEHVYCLVHDREGNTWMGTSQGLVRLQTKCIETLTTESGLIHDNVWTIAETRDDSVWIGTDGGISRVHDGRFTNYTQTNGLPENAIRAFAQDQSGVVWIGTGAGLARFDDGKFIRVPLPGDASGNRIRAIEPGRDGILWVGSEAGVHRLQNGQVTALTENDGLSDHSVRALHEDRTGSLWIGTLGGGLNRVQSGAITVFRQKDGLANDTVFALHEDSEGVLWVGTEGGLSRFKEGRFATVTTREGLPDDLVNQIIEDDLGHLWIGCSRGIYRLNREQLNAVADGNAPSLQVVSFDQSDGLRENKTNGGRSQPASAKTTDGRLWFSTPNGIVVINPRLIKQNDLPPPVVIEQALADNKPIFSDGRRLTETDQLSKHVNSRKSSALSPENPGPEHGQSPIRLSPGRGKVMEFHYTANSLTASHKNRFKYRLEGLETD